MKLDSKKELAKRVLGVGKERIIFDANRVDEIKEAITRQDIRDLLAAGAIRIKDIKGRRAIEKRRRRGPGSIKKSVSRRKKEYMALTRKLRRILKDMKNRKKVSSKKTEELRIKIKTRDFKDTAHFMREVGGAKS